MLDLAGVVAREHPDTHLYCCGPEGMLKAFKAACTTRPADHVHVEYFASSIQPAVSDGFFVVLHRSGKRLFVPEGNTILEILLAAGLDLPYSCQQGVCGACETVVI